MATGTTRNSLLAEQARALFTERVTRVLPELVKAIRERLLVLVSEPAGARDMQDRRDGMLAFDKAGEAWWRGTAAAWAKAKLASGETHTGSSGFSSGKFELMDKEVVEDKILASRLALRLLDYSSWELNDLRLRMQTLESVMELNKHDILRPEVLAQHLVEQWIRLNLPREVWLQVQDLIQQLLGEHLLEVYHATNELLIQRGVMAEIDLRPLVRRTPSGAASSVPQSLRQTLDVGAEGRRSIGLRPPPPASPPSVPSDFANSVPPQAGQRNGRDKPGQAVQDETRMQTATTPLARARQRAQGVMGHLKRLLVNQVSGFDDTRQADVTPQLAQAMNSAQRSMQTGDAERTVMAGASGIMYGQADVEQAVGALRDRTRALKTAAATSAEKATIEIVALMFQSILAEDRIPAGIRVWFARLQMPVLKLAISEPEFFGSLQHPARRLIDRMGSCVLGFDVTVNGGALEAEVKRIVQVIEQYPETGRRVFQLVYDEFDRFLSKFLSEQGSVARVVSVAQQVEQRETLSVQYTIELRNMLDDMPVRDEIRDFLFKTWADVLAVAAVKNGPQHQETLTLKQAAADLVWAASAKPSRTDRAKVIADLPKLLQLLRLGMSMLSLNVSAQDAHIKVISDTLADAFMSKTAAIPMERINAMADRLTNLEDYLSDEDIGDLPMDIENLVTMIGIDSTEIEVIIDGGSQPTEAMRAWAQELQLGAWFTLDHNNKLSHVQFAWCSDRKQLHLFAAQDGRNFLIQARRLASYLQAGLLVPTEEEALTVRATRDALSKLDANPERLLN